MTSSRREISKHQFPEIRNPKGVVDSGSRGTAADAIEDGRIVDNGEAKAEEGGRGEAETKVNWNKDDREQPFMLQYMFGTKLTKMPPNNQTDLDHLKHGWMTWMSRRTPHDLATWCPPSTEFFSNK